jgi:N-methylhydantoinase A
VPPGSRVFSATGLLFTTVEHRYGETFWHSLEEIDLEELNAVLLRLDQEARETLATEGFSGEEVELRPSIDMRYSGQNSELSIPAPPQAVTLAILRELVEAFHLEHERTYGYRSSEQVHCVNVRLRARGIPKTPVVPEALSLGAGRRQNASINGARTRQAYFGLEHGWVETSVISRSDLSACPRQGPVIVEEYDSTVVIPRGATAALDELDNIRIDVTPLL